MSALAHLLRMQAWLQLIQLITDLCQSMSIFRLDWCWRSQGLCCTDRTFDFMRVQWSILLPHRQWDVEGLLISLSPLSFAAREYNHFYFDADVRYSWLVTYDAHTTRNAAHHVTYLMAMLVGRSILGTKKLLTFYTVLSHIAVRDVKLPLSKLLLDHYLNAEADAAVWDGSLLHPHHNNMSDSRVFIRTTT